MSFEKIISIEPLHLGFLGNYKTYLCIDLPGYICTADFVFLSSCILGRGTKFYDFVCVYVCVCVYVHARARAGTNS
jgi:hypothetical protein